MSAISLAWVLLLACWAWLAFALTSAQYQRPEGLAGKIWDAICAEGRRLRRLPGRALVRHAAVTIWIATLFVDWSASFGPAKHVRPADAGALLLLVALAAQRPRRPLLPYSAVILLGMAAYGAVVIPEATNGSLALLGSVQLVELALVVTALVSLLLASDHRERRFYMAVFLVLAGLQAAMAVLQMLTKAGFANSPTRGGGTLGLFLGFVLVAPLIYAAWRALARTGSERIAWLALSCLLAIGLFVTQTRTSWAGAFAGVFLLVFLRNRRAAVASALALVVAAVSAGQIANALELEGGLLERVGSIVEVAQGRTLQSETWTVSARFAYWEASAETIADQPLGIGLKNFRLTLPALAREHLRDDLAWTTDVIEGPHNQFLFTTVELGIPGALLLLLLLGTAGALVLGLRRPFRSLGLALLVAVTVQALFGDILFGPLGMLTVGLLAMLEWQRREDRASEPSTTPVDGPVQVGARDLAGALTPAGRSR